MNLRDYFAAAALTQAEASLDTMKVHEGAEFIGIEAADYNDKIHWPMAVAKRAYQFADAMLSESQK